MLTIQRFPRIVKGVLRLDTSSKSRRYLSSADDIWDRTSNYTRESGSLPRRFPADTGEELNNIQLPKNLYSSLSKLTLVGRTGKDAEVREFQNGNKSLQLNVATNHASVGGEVETQWHTIFVSEDVTGFGFISNLSKGSLVYVHGDMRIVKRSVNGEMKLYVNVMVSGREGAVRVLSMSRRADVLDGELPV